MRIDSSYNDYYYGQNYQLTSISNANKSTMTADTSQNETAAVGFPDRSVTAGSANGSGMGLSVHGSRMRHSLQTQGADAEEMSEKLEKLKTDMESIQSADIDSMSAEEVKTTLSELVSDMEFLPKPEEDSGEVAQTDVDSLSESEMRDLLKQFQEQAGSMAAVEGGMPPGRPPMMAGPGPVEEEEEDGSISGVQSSTEQVSAGTDIQNVLQQVVDALTAAYDSTSGSREEYVEQLKSSLLSVFNQEKSSVDDFSRNLFGQLETWSGEQTISVEEA